MGQLEEEEGGDERSGKKLERGFGNPFKVL